MISEIYEFNTKLLNVKTGNPNSLTKAEFDWLLGALFEEIDELREAHDKAQIIDAVDALIDLSYFAIGGLVRMGLTEQQIQECFNTVHQANMAKKQGIKDTRPTDGSIADAIKPADWKAPEEKMKEVIFGANHQKELDL